MNEYIFIICGFTLFFGKMLLIIFGFFGYLRWMRYKETIILAEKGLLRPENGNGKGKGTLRWGIVITALGIALCLAGLACATSGTARRSPPSERAADYYPLAPGWKWAYEIEKGGQKILGTYAVTQQIRDSVIARATRLRANGTQEELMGGAPRARIWRGVRQVFFCTAGRPVRMTF